MKFKYTLSLTPESIDEFIKGVEEYQKWIEDCSRKLVKRLADEGRNIASVRFANSIYDGTNDVKVILDERGELKTAVVAVGNATLFIEFGTGINYPDDHPLAAENGMIRGEYGHGLGKNEVWGYYGDPGTNGAILPKTGLVLTRGNPANKPMYDTAKELRQELVKLVKEIFV